MLILTLNSKFRFLSLIKLNKSKINSVQTILKGYQGRSIHKHPKENLIFKPVAKLCVFEFNFLRFGSTVCG